jgi:hypothetical protein
LRDVEKGLRDRTRIGDAGRFHEQIVKAATFDQRLHTFDEVFANRAAETPVVHLHDLFFLILHQHPVDADLADFIDDDGKLVTVLLLQDVVEQGRLAGAQEAGENRHGNGFHTKLAYSFIDIESAEKNR